MKYFAIFPYSLILNKLQLCYLIAQNEDSRELQAVKRDNPESWQPKQNLAMKSISLFVLFWASINIHAVDNLRIPDIRSLGMGGNGVTQSVLFNPALVALNTDKVLHLEYFNRYGVKELGTVGIGFVYPNPLLSAGVDISSFGYDQYRETLFGYR